MQPYRIIYIFIISYQSLLDGKAFLYRYYSWYLEVLATSTWTRLNRRICWQGAGPGRHMSSAVRACLDFGSSVVFGSVSQWGMWRDQLWADSLPYFLRDNLIHYFWRIFLLDPNCRPPNQTRFKLEWFYLIPLHPSVQTLPSFKETTFYKPDYEKNWVKVFKKPDL
jgi:hypothetical protein